MKASILGMLNETDIFELKIYLENVNKLEEQIKQVNARIALLVDEKDVERISKAPGLWETSASSIMA